MMAQQMIDLISTGRGMRNQSSDRNDSLSAIDHRIPPRSKSYHLRKQP